MALTIEIPDEAVEALGMPTSQGQAELKKELAVALFARGALSLGRSVEVGGVSRAVFERILSERRIERSFTAAELERDLAWVRGAE